MCFSFPSTIFQSCFNTVGNEHFLFYCRYKAKRLTFQLANKSNKQRSMVRYNDYLAVCQKSDHSSFLTCPNYAHFSLCVYNVSFLVSDWQYYLPDTPPSSVSQCGPTNKRGNRHSSCPCRDGWKGSSMHELPDGICFRGGPCGLPPRYVHLLFAPVMGLFFSCFSWTDRILIKDHGRWVLKVCLSWAVAKAKTCPAGNLSKFKL